MQEKRLALKLVEVKIKNNWNPGGKEGLKKSINKVQKPERHQRGEIRTKEKDEELERKYNIKENGIRTVIRAQTATAYKNSKAEEI